MEATQKKSKAEEKESGATMLEYALIAVLIAVVCITAMILLGTRTSQSFSIVGSSFHDNN